jgi:hypothetical protein
MLKSKTIPALALALPLALVAAIQTAPAAQPEIVYLSESVTPRVLIATTASKSEVKAAQELTQYWGKITGKALTFERSDATPAYSPQQPLVVIGHHSANADLAATLSEVEETIIDARPGLLRLVGGRQEPIVEDNGTVFARDRGTLYAVYNVLDELGVRWYRPETWGEHVPKTAEIKLEAGLRRHKPTFKYRMSFMNYRYWSDTTAAQDALAMRWAYRNRVNTVSGYFIRNEEFGGTRFIHTQHNYSNLVPAKQYFKTNPEYFALVDGKRIENGQLCLGNPQVQELVAQKVLEFSDKRKRFETVSIEPDDHSRWCQCELCTAMDDPNQTTPSVVPDATPSRPMGNISTSNRVARFGTIIAQKVAQVKPDLKVVWLAYLQQTEPPSKVQSLPANTLVSPAAFSSAFSDPQLAYSDYSKALHDPTSAPNQRFVNVLQGWGKMTELITREYWSGIAWVGPMPLIATMKDRLTAYQKYNVSGFYNEVHPHWGPQGIDLYFYTRLAWKPEMDVEKELDLYCENYYGPAAEPMKRYHRLLEDAAHAGIPHYSYGINTYAIFTPQVLAEMEKHITQAKALIGAQEPYRKRFEGVWAGYEYTRLVTPYFPLLAEALKLPAGSLEADAKFLEAALHWERANKYVLSYKNGEVFDNGVMFGSLQFFGRYGTNRGYVPEAIRGKAKAMIAAE